MFEKGSRCSESDKAGKFWNLLEAPGIAMVAGSKTVPSLSDTLDGSAELWENAASELLLPSPPSPCKGEEAKSEGVPEPSFNNLATELG